MVGVTTRLTGHQIERFWREGFLVLERMVSDSELSILRNVYDRLFSGDEHISPHLQLEEERNPDGTYLPQILEPSRLAPELADTEFHRVAKCIARQVLGVVRARYGEHMIYKPPHYGAVTPWHQDQSRQDPMRRYRNINFWLSLDDTTAESGCMQYVPGSHRREVIFINPGEEAGSGAVACPIRAGGCVMHASYMLHCSGPNTSQTPRRAYILIFRAPPERMDGPIPFV